MAQTGKEREREKLHKTQTNWLLGMAASNWEAASHRRRLRGRRPTRGGGGGRLAPPTPLPPPGRAGQLDLTFTNEGAELLHVLVLVQQYTA